VDQQTGPRSGGEASLPTSIRVDNIVPSPRAERASIASMSGSTSSRSIHPGDVSVGPMSILSSLMLARSVVLPTLVGEAPSKKAARGRGPLSGPPARVLTSALGVDVSDPYDWLVERFVLVNLFRDFPGEPWPRKLAQAEANRLRGELDPDSPRVYLGRRVADAFGLRDGVYFTWYGLDPSVVVVPDPGGRNRLYDDPGNQDLLGSTLVEAMRRAI
jgi:hypothetical protein